MHLYTVCKVLETLPHSKTSTSSMHNQKSTSAVRQVIQVILQPLLFEVYFGPPLLHQALHFSKAPALTFKKLHFSTLQSPPNARVQIFFEPQMLADFSSLYLTAQIFRHHALLITKRDSCIFFGLCQYQLSFFQAKLEDTKENGVQDTLYVYPCIFPDAPITVVSCFLERSPRCGEKPSTYSLTFSLYGRSMVMIKVVIVNISVRDIWIVKHTTKRNNQLCFGAWSHDQKHKKEHKKNKGNVQESVHIFNPPFPLLKQTSQELRMLSRSLSVY